MTTLIDELVISLSLDPADFTKGQKEVAAGLLKTRDQADSSTKQIEASGKRAANYMASLKNEVVGLFLAFAGAKGLTEFASGMIDNAAAAGRLSANIGVSTDRIGAWQGAVKEMNGTADEANAALSAMSQAIGNYQLTRSTGNDAVFRALGVGVGDLNAGPDAMLMRIAAAGEHMARVPYVNLLQRLGFGPAMIATLEQGSAALGKTLEQQQRNYDLTKNQAQAAQQFQKNLADLTQIIQGDAAPALEKLVGFLNSVSTNSNEGTVAMAALTGIIGAAAVAAGVAYAPLVALATVLGAVALAYERLSTAKGRARVGRNLAEDGNFLKALWGAFHQGGGAATDSALAKVFADAEDGKFRPPGDDPAPSAGGGGVGGHSGRTMATAPLANIVAALTQRGAPVDIATGIAAGIKAEGGGLGMSANGAFGIGQWRGARYQALIRKYGPNPTLHQQFDFLWAELNGGDPGGASVLGAHGAYGAAWAYAKNFMRPDKPGTGLTHTMEDYRRASRYIGGTGGGGTVNFNGPVTITTQATDGRQLVNGLPKSVHRRLMATPANSGVN